MDNNELDSYLSSKFKALQTPPEGPSLERQIMARIAQGEQLEAPAPMRTVPAGQRKGDWLVALACLLAALVCVPTLGDFDGEQLSALLPLELLGAYAPTLSALLWPLLLIIALFPTAWLVLED